MPEEFEDVLQFWFPPQLSGADHATMVSQFEWWFRGGADSAITERFQPLLEQAARGATRPLVEQPTIAPRADHRPRSVLAIDPSGHGAGVCARSEGARSGASGHRDRSLRGPRDAVGEDFLLLALGAFRGAHASGGGGQARRGTRRAQAPAELRRILEHSAAQARGHRDVIARFGRHPHRNAVLGRQSTPEELDYLAGGQLVHRDRCRAEFAPPGRAGYSAAAA